MIQQNSIKENRYNINAIMNTVLSLIMVSYLTW